MANPGLSELITSTLRNRTAILKDNYMNNNAVIYMQKKHGGIEYVGGGRTLVEEMFYAENSTFTRYSGSDTLNVATSDVITAAEFNWKQFALSVVIDGLTARQNAGKEGIIKLLAARIKNGEGTLKNNLNADMVSDGTASSSKQIGGLKHLISKTPTSGTVGGIDRSTSAGTFYRNYAYDATNTGGAVSSASNIKTYFNRVKINTTWNNEGPKFVLAGNSIYEYVLTAAQAIQQFTDPDMAKLGFENIVFCGMPVVLGGGVNFGGQTLVGATDAYFINPEYLKLKIHEDCDMKVLPIRQSFNQDAEVRLIAWMGNMTLSQAKVQAVLFDS